MCFLSKLALYSLIFPSHNHYENENLSTKYKGGPLYLRPLYFRKNPVINNSIYVRKYNNAFKAFTFTKKFNQLPLRFHCESNQSFAKYQYLTHLTRNCTHLLRLLTTLL
jgi:hypothetical protein